MAHVEVKDTVAFIVNVRPLVVSDAALSKFADSLASEELTLRWKAPPLSVDFQPDDMDFSASPSPSNCSLKMRSFHHQLHAGPAVGSDENTIMAPEDASVCGKHLESGLGNLHCAWYSQLVHPSEKVIKEPGDRIEIHGIGENCSQCRLKEFFKQFGEVIGCQIGKRGVDFPVVRFAKPEDADAAMTALRKGQVFLDGVMLTGEMNAAPVGGRAAKLKAGYCSFYDTPRGCKYGDQCEFHHDQLHAQHLKAQRAKRQKERREKYDRQRAALWAPLPCVAPSEGQ